MNLFTKPAKKGFEPTEEDWKEYWAFCEEQDRRRQAEEIMAYIDMMLFEEAYDEMMANLEQIA